MRLILPRYRLLPAAVASFTLSGGYAYRYASSSLSLLVLVSSRVTAFTQNRQFSRTTTLLFSSSRFRDDESGPKYDALKEELRNAESTTSTMQSEPEPAPSPPDGYERASEASTLDNLLGKAMGRAARTISNLNTRSDYVSGDNDTAAEQIAVEDVIDGSIARADRVLSEKNGAETSNQSVRPREQAEQTNEKHHIDKREYLSNPCVTPTALAHSLWKSTVRPNVDTVIDATCGNGKDSVALAEILFAPLTSKDDDQPQPELVCIDIQSRAVANTTQALQGILDEDIYNQYCRVMATSHAPLPKPRDSTSVGLVCYNLGWLPGSSSDDKDAFATKTFTTIISLTDAALLLRVGGLLSVMTYPGSTPTEADAVRYFCEGLAMLTTRDKRGWLGYVDSIPPDSDGSGATTVRDIVRSSLERVVREGNNKKQTWRAYEHKPLGRPLSPILIAAMRIK
mmetsp:Transcript_19784/g.42600  ORF Transcript_19784/g.42600 Transcript_19784/m.42600 type:complete len:454 (+) Transcript_19784:101-1462(+)